MSLDTIIQKRKSVHGFSDKKADWRKIIKAIDAARYAPMAGNIFTLKFIVIDDAKKISLIAESAQQHFIANASHAIVICSKPILAKIQFAEQGEMFIHQQAGAAIQNILLKLEEQGLASCWIGYFIEKDIKTLVNIPNEMKVEAILSVGHASKLIKEREKAKSDLDAFLYFNKYGEKKMNS